MSFQPMPGATPGIVPGALSTQQAAAPSPAGGMPWGLLGAAILANNGNIGRGILDGMQAHYQWQAVKNQQAAAQQKAMLEQQKMQNEWQYKQMQIKKMREELRAKAAQRDAQAQLAKLNPELAPVLAAYPGQAGSLMASIYGPAKPTSLEQQLAAAGFTPGTPAYQAKMLELLQKPTGSNVTVNTGKPTPPYKIPSDYMLADPDDYMKGVVPIPKGPADKRSGETAGKEAMIDTAQHFMSSIDSILFDPDGGINRSALAEKAAGKVLPGAMVPEGSKLANSYEIGIQAITRLETGAAMPPQEVENTRKRFEPSVMDSDDVIRQKYLAYRLFLQNAKRYLDPNAAQNNNWAVNVDLAFADAQQQMQGGGQTRSSQASSQGAGIERTINGVTYIKKGNDWYEKGN